MADKKPADLGRYLAKRENVERDRLGIDPHSVGRRVATPPPVSRALVTRATEAKPDEATRPVGRTARRAASAMSAVGRIGNRTPRTASENVLGGRTARREASERMQGDPPPVPPKNPNDTNEKE